MSNPAFIGFTQADIKFVLSLAKGLGACKQHGRWFQNLVEKGKALIDLESIDNENDWMDISECSIQKAEIDIPGIVPRKAIKYKVFIPQYIPSNSYWDPDDIDIKEIGTFDSLAEAFSEFYMLEAETFARDNATATVYEEMKSVEEEQV